jgi:murein DD-endopeptidase MepM/ murein hydrolase activator NlpD
VHNDGVKTAFILCAAMLAVQPQAAQAPRAAVITAQPGDVVRVDGEVTVFAKKWKDLIGIDLTTKPGAYRLSSGTMLRVLPKQFPVRRLTVAAAFVTPPADALAQIANDTRKTSAIWQRVTPRKWSGGFLLPVDDPSTSSFGTRSFFNGQPRSPHTGTDFLSPLGRPVRASNHGEVVLAEPLYFTGNTVIVDYGDGLYSLFAHLSELRAHQGDIVQPDTIVGLVGATGRVTGPHLHWGVKLQGANVDGLTLVAATRTDRAVAR